MHASALYFPTISFASTSALKASLLVWDRVYRIVPDHYELKDDPEVATAIEAGLVRSVHLESADLTAAAERFETLVDGLMSLPAGLDPGGGLGGLVNIHLDKIDARLYPVLEGLAGQMSDNWMALRPEVARGYMLALALEVGKRRQLTLTTDDPDAWVASAFIGEGGDFSEYVFDDEAEAQYCQLGFNDILPLDAGTLEMDKIVTLSRQSAEDRAAFRTTVAELAMRVAACESRSHVEDMIRDYRASQADAVEALRRKYGFFRRHEGYALLSVGVPITASILASLIPAGIDSASAIGSAITVGLVGALGESRRDQPPQDRVASYLLQAQKAVGAPRPDLRLRMEEFIND